MVGKGGNKSFAISNRSDIDAGMGGGPGNDLSKPGEDRRPDQVKAYINHKKKKNCAIAYVRRPR